MPNSLYHPVGYHVPTKDEWEELSSAVQPWTDRMHRELKLPAQPYRFEEHGRLHTIPFPYYWTSSAYSGHHSYYYDGNTNGTWNTDRGNEGRATGFSVRCIKD